MATARRRPLKSVAQAQAPVRAGLAAQLSRAAASRTAKVVYCAVGAAGLAALAVAIIGPRRLQREILQPVRSAVGDQAGKLWDDARPLREQLAELFARAASDSGREKLVRGFQSWIGHFRAT